MIGVLFMKVCFISPRFGNAIKTFSVKIKDDTYIKYMDYMETEKFKTLYKERYNIETINDEIIMVMIKQMLVEN